jgi:hypothetical protein
MSAALASAGRAFDKIKAMLEEMENEKVNTSESGAAPYVSSNHHPAYATDRRENRAASGNRLDEAGKLPAGERRILTALAQYPQGRSKAQVAVLAGYALNGGGFNNYLAIFAQPLKKVKIRASAGSRESLVGKVKPLDW